MITKQFRYWTLAALFLVALGIRVASNIQHFLAPIDPGTRNFEIFDSSYQIRRVAMILDQFPRVPFSDPYHYFPDRPDIPWPPGYNLLLASMAWPFHHAFSNPLVWETVVGVVPCVIDAISVVLFTTLFAQFVAFPIAALSGILLSVSFMNVGFSEVGYIDHQYFVSFLIISFCWALTVFRKNPSVKTGLQAAVILGSGIFFNVSAIQYILLTLITLGITYIFERPDPKEQKIFPPISTTALISLLLGTIIMMIISSQSTPAGRALKISYDQTSLFQVALTFSVGLAIVLGSLWIKPNSISKRTKVLSSLGLALITLGLAVISFENVMEGARFLFVGNRLNYVQGEEQSVLSYYPMWARLFTPLVLILPIGLVHIWKTHKNNLYFITLFSIFFIHGFFSSMAHLLYLQYFYPWYALALAAGATWCWKRGQVWGQLLVIGLAAITSFFVVTELLFKQPSELAARRAIAQTIKAFAWLRDHSPKTAGYETGTIQPEYSVMAYRDFGHQIIRTAHRPVVVSPFSTTAFVGHMQDYARLALTKSEEDVIELMNKYTSRYLVVDHRSYSMREFLLNVLEGEPDQAELDESSKSSPFVFVNNLLLFDGELRWKKTPSVKHHRLIYEVEEKVSVSLMANNKPFVHQFNGLKIFERVTGATILLRNAPAQSRIQLMLPLKTNSGRTWTYTAYAETSDSKDIKVIVPYASEPTKNSAIFPEKPAYDVVINGIPAGTIQISDAEVREGLIREISSLKRNPVLEKIGW